MTLGRVVQAVLLLLGLAHTVTAQPPYCSNFTPPRYFDVSTSFCLDSTRGWVALYYPVEDTSSIAATVDGGKNWTIQQVGGVGLSPRTIFFSSRLKGWLGLYNSADDTSSIATTVDGGKNWTIQQVDGVGYSPKSLFFLDEQRGWLMLFFTPSTHMNLECKILKTQDGGSTWTELRGVPPCTEMRFVSSQIGWVIGNSGEGDPTQLWITRDGGNSWNSQALPMPKNCKHCEILFHDPPQFGDVQHGTFWVEMLVGRMETIEVTYVTANGGICWKIAKSVAEIPSY